jgi:hypothetical protein
VFTGDPLTVRVERGFVDEAGVVLPDQHLPFCLRQATHPLARLAVLVDVALTAGLPERVRARIDGVLEHAVDLVVGRDDPLNLAVREALHRELHPLATHPRVSARRGKPIAIIAVARKLVVLFWHLLTREEDYAFARPSLTRHKRRAHQHPNAHQQRRSARR